MPRDMVDNYIVVHIHSSVDVITNSSTTVFVSNSAINKAFLKNTAEKLLPNYKEWYHDWVPLEEAPLGVLYHYALDTYGLRRNIQEGPVPVVPWATDGEQWFKGNQYYKYLSVEMFRAHRERVLEYINPKGNIWVLQMRADNNPVGDLHRKFKDIFI